MTVKMSIADAIWGTLRSTNEADANGEVAKCSGRPICDRKSNLCTR
jgi:hypothetical protein